MKKATLLSALAITAASATGQTINYPPAPQDNTTDEYFGETVADPFRPLENDTAAATKAWIEAENAVTDAYLRRIPFRGKLLKRLREVSDYERTGIPFEENGRWYVYRNDGLQNQSVLYQMDKPGGTQRVFLDPNKLSSDGTVALQGTSFSHDGRFMAYIISRSGSDWQEIYVCDARTGRQLDDHILWAKFTGAVWCGDGFYYSAYDAPQKGKEYSSKNEVHKIYYHRMGTPQSQDRLFYENPTQPLRFYTVSVNREETVMFLYESGAGSGNNLYVRDLRVPGSQFIQLTDNMDLQYNPVQTVGDSIYIYTNDGAPRNRLMLADIRNPARKNWREVVAETQDVLEDVTFTGGRMILSYSKDASTHAFLSTMDGQRIREIDLPAAGSAYFRGKRDRHECFYLFTSFTVPGTVYAYEAESGISTVYSQPRIAFRQEDFITEQIFYPSKDGTRIPMFLTYRKGLKRNGHNPVYLYGYGGFNISLPPSFNARRIPFLEAGGIYAQACLRGGSEYGESWHVAGTKMQKQNVFDDFIAAAQWLIDSRYTSPKRLAIVGGSNGGLLVGACMTQRPDLFRVCVPQVGVMDMLRYHRFTIGWNWAPDYGTSEDSPEMFRYLRAYSPLHNLRPGTAYPSTLVTTADHDDRVVPAHSFKFAAMLQKCQSGSAPVLIRIDSKAGHGAGKPLSKQLEEAADVYGFIMYNLGMKF